MAVAPRASRIRRIQKEQHMTLPELLEKLKTEAEGSQTLDDAIRDVVLGEPVGRERMMWRPGAFSDFPVYDHPNGERLNQLWYTRSIDAALRLIPRDVNVNFYRDSGSWFVTLEEFRDDGAWHTIYRSEAGDDSAALALCVAAVSIRQRA